MACGVATLVLSIGSYRSLDETRRAYYERYRFADVFTSAERAPKSLAGEISAIDGVAAVEIRIVKQALLDVEGMREPATGALISIPPNGDFAVNALFLREGRMPAPGRSNEVLVSRNFAEAHGFAIGSEFKAVIAGSKVSLSIVGIAMSPEYVYAIGPGDFMPDNRRFGVIWLSEKTLAALYDLDGAFNSVSLRLLHDANQAAVIERLNALLERYGGTGAVGRKDQQSNAFLDHELSQLLGLAKIVPPLFLLVTAFLVNMVLSRLISLEREQIGLLKALGYGRMAVAWHYLKLVLVIAAAGIAIGFAIGTWLGWGMTVMYSRFYSFPFLIFRTSADVYLLAAGVTLLAAVAGALQAVRIAFALPPAVAMRPPVPTVYRQILTGRFERLNIFSQLTTMALRHLVRHPLRTALTAVGTSFSVGLLAIALGTIASVDFMIDAVFFRTDRQDARITFTSARPVSAEGAIAALPGILQAESFLNQPARITNGQYSRDLVITGKPPATDLSRILDLDLNPVRLPESGLALGDRVAAILHVDRGDIVRVTMLDGDRRTVAVPVTEVIQSYLGLMVFMDIDALARLAGTGPRVSGVDISVDPTRLDELYRAIKDTPQISGIGLQAIARQVFQSTMRENIVFMLLIYLTLSVIVAFGVVYNSARIQLSERAGELATLRVLGFGRAEVSNVLFIELGAIVLGAQPIGWVVGSLFGYLITQSLATDLFRVPLVFEKNIFATASLVVVGAALVSALIVRRRIDRLDLVRVLKTRE
jgi:putative ABC transport system permease protein